MRSKRASVVYRYTLPACTPSLSFPDMLLRDDVIMYIFRSLSKEDFLCLYHGQCAAKDVASLKECMRLRFYMTQPQEHEQQKKKKAKFIDSIHSLEI